MSTTTTPTGRAPNLRLAGTEAQYAMRYLRFRAGRRPGAGHPPASLVPSRARREQIERFVDTLLDEACPC